MKKFLFILLAAGLALFVAVKVTNLQKKDSTLPTELPEISSQEPFQIEENLSYGERIEKGNYFYDRGFLSYAVNEYVKAANLEPKRTEPYFKLMQANFDLAEYDKAKLNAETILNLDPENSEAQFFLAKIFIKQMNFEKAREALNALPQEKSTDPTIQYHQALLEIMFNNHEAGKTLLKKVQPLLTDENLASAVSDLLGSYDEFDFSKAAEPLYLEELIARSFNRIGEYEMAIYKLKEVLKTRSDLRDAWILLGFAYLNLEKYYFALTGFEKAYQIDPEWPITPYFLGLTYSELGNDNDAITYFNYALSNGFEPKAVVQKNLADLYLKTKDYKRAVDAYRGALESNQEDISAFVRPIWIYLDFLNQPSEALKLAEIAVATFPEQAMSYNLLGWSQTGIGNTIEAEKNLKKAISINPDFAAAYYNLGKLYQGQNKKTEALDAFQKAYELDQSGSIGNLAAQQYNELLNP